MDLDLKRIIEDGFAHGPVRLVLDTRCEGVVVPLQFRGVINLQLAFSPKFKSGPPEVEAERISQVLSFDGEDFCCIVPFNAVSLCVLGNREVFTFYRHMPEEAQVQLIMGLMGPPMRVEPPTEPKEPARTGLQVLKGGLS